MLQAGVLLVTGTASSPALRAASPADLPAIERLLAESHLPVAGVAGIIEHRPDDFVVAEDPQRPGELAAVAGIEVCCDSALLRSVAVKPEWRAHGLGAELVTRLVCHAESRGIHALYLLTMTAEHYFPRFGFQRIARGEVPSEIASTVEFTSACPASATVMRRAV